MTLTRRASALVMSLLLLQFTLAGSGLACTAPTTTGSSATMRMDGMDMGTSERITQDEATNAPGVSDAPSPQTPCGAPIGDGNCGDSDSGNTCGAMTSCGPPVLGADATASALIVAPGSGTPRTSFFAPPARATAPDLPPPRA